MEGLLETQPQTTLETIVSLESYISNLLLCIFPLLPILERYIYNAIVHNMPKEGASDIIISNVWTHQIK